MSTVLDRIHSTAAARQQGPMRDYVVLVRQVHADTDVDPDDALAVLNAAEKSAQELEADAQMYARWLALRDAADAGKVSQLQATAEENTKVLSAAVAARKVAVKAAKDAAEAEYRAKQDATRASDLYQTRRKAAYEANRELKADHFKLFNDYAA